MLDPDWALTRPLLWLALLGPPLLVLHGSDDEDVPRRRPRGNPPASPAPVRWADG